MKTGSDTSIHYVKPMVLIIFFFSLCFAQGKWEHVTNSTNLSLPSLLEFQGLAWKNKMWLFKGCDADFTLSDKIYNSEDGKTWTVVKDSAEFFSRAKFGITKYNGYIWITGGEEIPNY